MRVTGEQRKGDRERVSSIIRLFTSETGCKCYSICLMESLSAFLPSFLEQRAASRFVSAFLRSPNFLPPPFLLTAALLPPLVNPPFHDSSPHSLYLSPPSLPISSIFLLLPRIISSFSNAPRIRLDQRFPMPSFPRREAFSFFRISRPLRCPRITRKRRGWSDLKCSDSARR